LRKASLAKLVELQQFGKLLQRFVTRKQSFLTALAPHVKVSSYIGARLSVGHQFESDSWLKKLNQKGAVE